MSDTNGWGRAEMSPGQEIRFTITYTWWARIRMLLGWNMQPITVTMVRSNEFNIMCEELVRK